MPEKRIQSAPRVSIRPQVCLQIRSCFAVGPVLSLSYLCIYLFRLRFYRRLLIAVTLTLHLHATFFFFLQSALPQPLYFRPLFAFLTTLD